MRVAAIILVFIIIALSCVPCSDAPAFLTKAKQEISKTQNHSDSKSDQCSPFCICSCCAGFYVNHTFFQYSSLNILSKPTYAAFLPYFIVEFPSAIWQPPQL